MNPLENFTSEYIAQLAGTYYTRQLIVIMCIFVFGAVLTDCFLGKDKPWVLRGLLAFPVGLSAFSVTAYAMLVIGIPYGKWTVCAVIAAEAAGAVFAGRRSFDGMNKVRVKHMAVVTAVAAAVAAFATSGLAPVSISNDTMYFFRRYPDCIVYYGGLREQFDFWLTDTGLGVVSIDTLPALFGFGESFGIREFFHIGFIAFFCRCVYLRAQRYVSKKSAVIATVVVTAFLVVCTPFVILGHWALANMYFMELFFIAAFEADPEDDEISAVRAILLIALSLLRIEGTMFVIWLILCIDLYSKAGKKLAKRVVIPMLLLFGMYCFRIFVIFYVLDNIYLFLTPAKAVMIIMMIVGCGIYLLFIRPVLPEKISQKLPLIYIAALAMGNLVLFVSDKEHYIGNLKAFGANLFRQSGWGMLPYFVLGMTVILAVEYGVMYAKKTGTMDGANRFNIVTVAGFILIVLAASFGRGDVLYEEIGDSGNRVLLQIVPMTVMMYAELFFNVSV